MANSNFGRDENKNNVNLDEWVKQYLGESQTDITELREKVNNMWSTLFPVGSIYLSTSSTNPNEFMGGGTWVLWGSGRVPVGINTGDTDFSPAEKVGGVKNHTHKLETGYAKIGMQTSNNTIYSKNVSQSSYYPNRYGTMDNIITPSGTGSDTTELGGNTDVPTAIPMPYIVCYMWKRTA